jgi:hypothetical protein
VAVVYGMKIHAIAELPAQTAILHQELSFLHHFGRASKINHVLAIPPNLHRCTTVSAVTMQVPTANTSNVAGEIFITVLNLELSEIWTCLGKANQSRYILGVFWRDGRRYFVRQLCVRTYAICPKANLAKAQVLIYPLLLAAS